MRTLKRWLIGIGCTVVALLLIATLALTVVARAPLPKYDGELRLAGLSGEVTIRRDELGVPHIHATNDRDLMFAQGLVHAQDRFFQMDMRRHITAGRLSELVGEGGKESDIAVRTMGFRRAAEQDWEQLSDETRGLYEAYAAGVNAHIQGKAPWQIANEYTVLGLSVPFGEIEPWQPADSLAWLKAMSNSLSAGHFFDAGSMEALEKLGSPAAVEELSPVADEAASRPIVVNDGVSNLRPRGDYPVADPVPLPKTEATEVDCPPEIAAEATPDALTTTVQSAGATVKKVAGSLGEGRGIGSNSFVIGGQHTASGKPILGNDPHLEIDHPSVWSQVGLHCTGDGAGCSFDVEGFSFAGMPGVLIGRNPDLAWAFTSLGGDVSDLVVERNVGENAYLRDGRCLAYATRTETIQVAGGEPVELTIKESVHGPVVSGLFTPDENFAQFPGRPDDFSVALQWVALIPSRTAEAIFDLNRASDAAGVAAAAAKFSDPAQNILFATTAGDIGYQAPGLHPIRPIKSEADQNHGLHGADALGADGRWPRPGWDSSYDWQGFYAPEDMPAVLNPPDGIIVPANQPVTPKDSGPFLNGWYLHGYRSQAMYDELARMAKAGPISEDQAWQVMLLDRFPGADELGAAFTGVELEDARLREQQEVLRRWLDDGAHMAVDQPGAAIMAALSAHLVDQVLSDELGKGTFAEPNTLAWLVTNPDHRLWDDRTTPETEDATAILHRTWAAADADLTAQLGADHSTWAWGKIHVETPTHQVLGREGLPGPIRWYFNRPARAVGGTGDAPNASWFNATVGDDGRVNYEVVSGASMRMTVDLAALDRAHWSTSSGVSGHPLSKHYDDQFATWAEGGKHPWPFTTEAIEATTRHRLVLRPA
ncbi:MAG: penicillin acylase family protein [Propionibacteriaceae bacterium]|nr:penicillin acylase family protein [Propionibacteriaceae bacterium]